MPLLNDRLLRVLKGELVDRPPIWFMRQAGRYLPEYRATREKAGDFLTLCNTPELACEVTLQPLARYPLDAAIIFSDILIIPDGFGLGLYFVEGEGPRLKRPIQSEADILALSADRLAARFEPLTQAIQLTKRALAEKTPLIGFCGSPFTLSTYMIENKAGEHGAEVAKHFAMHVPTGYTILLEKLTDAVIACLKAQAAAGADVLMIFDSWGGALDYHAFQTWSLQALKRIVTALMPLELPIILFTKGGGPWLPLLGATGCAALGIDWSQSLQMAHTLAPKVALQGNLDPAYLEAPLPIVKDAVLKVLKDGQGLRHIFNLGHGIKPSADLSAVSLMVDTVISYKGDTA